jgi:hypothetical protein
MAEASTPEFQPQRLVMVCEDAPERQAVIKAALEQLGLTMFPAKTAEEAIGRLRRDPFEAVILDEQFQGSSPLDNAVLKDIQGMQMAVRRYIFVILLGREYKTFDNMMAFTRSVNVVVNLNDLPHLPAILRKGLQDNHDFYRVFRDMQAEIGKR